MTSVLDTHRPRLMLVLLCLLLWFPGILTLPAGDRDESRFTQATKQMLETGDYVRIQNGLEARNRKPIGIHWLQVPFVAAADALGLTAANPVWPYRLPSVLGGIIAVLACYAAGERLLGGRVALLGAGMLAATLVLVAETHIAKTDAALLGATTLAMAMLARAWTGAMAPRHAALFWLALGAGVLLKGPITPMVAGLAVIALGASARRWAWLNALRPAWGLPLMLAVVTPWFVAIGIATEGRFFTDAVGGDLGRKLASGEESHWGPPGMHLALLPLLLFPASAAFPAAVALAWRERASAATRFLLAWIVPAWIVFEAAPTKLPHYTLPLYPAICLLLARAALGPGLTGRWRFAGPVLAAIAAAALAIGALGAPVMLRLDPWVGLPAAAAAAAVAAFAVRAAQAKHAARAVIASGLIYAAVLGWELPRLAPLWIAPRAVAGMPAGRLGSVGFSEPSLMFLAGSDTLWLRPGEAADMVADGMVDTLLVAEGDLPTVMERAEQRRLKLVRGAVVVGFNYARGRWMRLTVLSR